MNLKVQNEVGFRNRLIKTLSRAESLSLSLLHLLCWPHSTSSSLCLMTLLPASLFLFSKNKTQLQTFYNMLIFSPTGLP